MVVCGVCFNSRHSTCTQTSVQSGPLGRRPLDRRPVVNNVGEGSLKDKLASSREGMPCPCGAQWSLLKKYWGPTGPCSSSVKTMGWKKHHKKTRSAKGAVPKGWAATQSLFRGPPGRPLWARKFFLKPQGPSHMG